MSHTVTMPDRIQRPECSCGWAPDLPWPVTWARWEADVTEHLAQFVTCPDHGQQTALSSGRCPQCHNNRHQEA